MTSRRSTSSAASRNFSGSFRADLHAPGGLHQSSYTSSNTTAACRGLHEDIDDHKENCTENGDGKGAPGRVNHNQKGPFKKAWVTHFSKPAATLSPSNRVLVDRNSSCSPVRSGSIALGNGEILSDKKVTRPTTPTGAEKASATPSLGKGVAELSKRIQQFLEDQDVLLGVSTGSALKETCISPSVTPAEPGHRPSSSPYNPYKSPFFERPKFLRLNGNVSAEEGADLVSAATDGVGMSTELPAEEIPLFKGDRVVVTTLQQIQLRTSLSPSFNEGHQEVRLEDNCEEQNFAANTEVEASMDILEEKCEEQMFGANTAVEDSVDVTKRKALPTSPGEADCLHDLKGEETREGTGKLPGEAATVQFQDQVGPFQDEVNVADVKVEGLSMNVAPSEAFPVCQGEDQSLSMATSEPDQGKVTVDRDEMTLAKKAVRVLFSGALLATFLSLVLLSSASPALLPRCLVDNPVNLFWQPSKVHEYSMLITRGLDGLWSENMIYIPADARLAVLRGAELYQVMGKHFRQAQQVSQFHIRVVSSIATDWGRILVQQLSRGTNPDTAKENEDRARQFEWIQDFEFVEEWVDEFPKQVYTDWELLHEYDLGAANQFVLGSIPDSLKNDMRRNFSQLSDSPEVKDLLEDLMKLKGGSSEEDRMEVLHYFWEYRRFSTSAHENLMKIQLATTALEVERKNKGLSTSSDDQHVEPASEDVEMHNDQSQQKIHFTDSKDHIKDNYYQTSTEIDEQLHDLDEHLSEERSGMEREHFVPKTREMALEEIQDSKATYFVEPASEGVEMHNGQSQQRIHSKDSKDHTKDNDYQTPTETPTEKDEQLPDLYEHLSEERGMEQEHFVPKTREMALEELQESMANEYFHTRVTTANVNEAVLSEPMHELQREVGNEDTSSTDIPIIQPISDINLDIAQLATLAAFIVASFLILGHSRDSKKAVKLVSYASSVKFLRKSDQPPNSMDDEAHQSRQHSEDFKQVEKQVTLIEELSNRFAFVPQSPEPNNLSLRSTHVAKDEDIVRSPIPTSATSPYGSFTTYKIMSTKEGQASESKLTPVRRSSRIRNHVSMSPNANGVKRIAISPP